MNSTTFYKNDTRRNVFYSNYKNELKLNTPFTLILSLTVAFLVVIIKFMNLWQDYNASLRYDFELSYSMELGLQSLVLFPMFGFVLALIQFKIFSNKQSMDVYASLPITRSEFFWSKVSAGMVMLLVPIFISDIIVFVINLSFVGFNVLLLEELFFIMFAQLVLVLIPYSLTAMVSTLTGTVIENIIYPLVLYFSPVILFNFVLVVLNQTVLGFVSMEAQDTVTEMLFPNLGILYTDTVSKNGSSISIYTVESITEAILRNPQIKNANVFSAMSSVMLILSVWLVICVVLFLLANKFAKNRKVENAGRKSVCKPLHTISCFVASALGGFLLSILANALFGIYDGWTPFSNIMFILGTLLAFVIYQAVILQSIKAIFKSLLKYAIYSVAFIAFLIMVNTNIFGVYSTPLNPDDFISGRINPSSREIGFSYLYKVDFDDSIHLKDKASVEAGIAFVNKAIANGKSENFSNLYVELVEKNGNKIERQYHLDENTVNELLAAYEESNFLQNEAYSNTETIRSYDYIRVSDIFQTNNHVLSEEEKANFDYEKFYECIRKDLDNTTVTDLAREKEPEVLRLDFIKTVNDPADYDVPVGETKSYEDFRSMGIKASFTNTIEYLDSIGFMQYSQTDFSKITSVQYVKPNVEMLSKYVDGYAFDSLLNIFSGIPTYYMGDPDLFEMCFKDLISNQKDENNKTITDEQEIKELLSTCFIENYIDDDFKIVYVKTTENSNLFIQP